LDFDSQYGSLYFARKSPFEIGKEKSDVWAIPLDNLVRDGAIRVTFEFVNIINPSDNWFGIYFRAYRVPIMHSCLFFIRNTGMLVYASFPGPFEHKVIDSKRQISGKQELLLAIENNFIQAKIGDVELTFDNILYQNAGRFFLSTWNSLVKIHSLEIICRDTIDFSNGFVSIAS
jgi:hypothetical protein